jgi:hypothetical protein
MVGIGDIAAPYDLLLRGVVPRVRFAGLPASAVLAATRVQATSAPFDALYAGFDYLIIANVSDQPLALPRAGYGFSTASAMVSLQRGGWITEPRFGGFQQVVDALLPGEGYVFLLPDTLSGAINLGATLGGQSCAIRTGLARGETVAMLGPAPCGVADASMVPMFVDGFEGP